MSNKYAALLVGGPYDGEMELMDGGMNSIWVQDYEDAGRQDHYSHLADFDLWMGGRVDSSIRLDGG